MAVDLARDFDERFRDASTDLDVIDTAMALAGVRSPTAKQQGRESASNDEAHEDRGEDTGARATSSSGGALTQKSLSARSSVSSAEVLKRSSEAPKALTASLTQLEALSLVGAVAAVEVRADEGAEELRITARARSGFALLPTLSSSRPFVLVRT